MVELDTAGLRQALANGHDIRRARMQDVDLRHGLGEELLRHDVSGVVILGGHIPQDVGSALAERGVIIFPPAPDVPINVYRSQLYNADELYGNLFETRSYSATPDARAYEWFMQPGIQHDPYASAMMALHDASIHDALEEALEGRKTVGVMGGHALERGSSAYSDVAYLGRALAKAGYVVMTGGGPGAMEAANVGAFAPDGDLDGALDLLAEEPTFAPRIDAWAMCGFAARSLLKQSRSADDPLHSLGAPTWFYGHEPPNVFGDAIAKYFSNAVREDALLAGSHDAIIVLEGAAGTVQEIFQSVTPMYYAKPGTSLPHLILVGVEQWTSTIPVWAALTALADGKEMSTKIHLVDTPNEALDIVTG